METYRISISTIKTVRKILPYILIVFFSCSQQTNVDDDYIVPVRIKPVFETQPGEPPPPPPIQTYYLPADFIIDTAGQIYFYQQQRYGFTCGSGIDWDTPPKFIDLRPNDIIRVPISNIEDFIKLNILTIDTADRLVAIALIKDTIHSIGLTKIFKIFNDTTYHIKWNFRKATEEESIVLGYKQRNQYYNSAEIKWDSTKIEFPPLYDDVQYTPTKVEE